MCTRLGQAARLDCHAALPCHPSKGGWQWQAVSSSLPGQGCGSAVAVAVRVGQGVGTRAVSSSNRVAQGVGTASLRLGKSGGGHEALEFVEPILDEHQGCSLVSVNPLAEACRH